MKKISFLLMALCMTLFAQSQFTAKIIIRDSLTQQVLPAASIFFKATNETIIADKNGFIELRNISEGKHVISVSHTGYETKRLSVIAPFDFNDTLEILLTTLIEELDGLIIQSTRTSRTINNVPTRVEMIDDEEIAEKANMRPSNVSMLLHESTGLQVQQTSATSGNASIRVQGLDGKYTQLLKDGYPNFGNFASGLSILEIPPLDLAQVEIIKGPASTLYGGGAIAGVINFISKTPKDKATYNAIINQSNVGQTNIGGYASQKFKNIGYSMLALLNFQKAYDVDKDDFSELPESNNFTLNPRLFLYPGNKTMIMIGNNLTKGKNTGGDMQVIKGKIDSEHVYFEKNTTIRNTTTFELERKLTGKNNFRIKQSFSLFDREIAIPGYVFAGVNTNSFTDASFIIKKKTHLLNTGFNIIYDKFRQRSSSTVMNQNNSSFTSGLFVQDTWDINEKIIVEGGIRLDHVKYNNDHFVKKQIFILPRVSTLFKINSKMSSRIGAGLGYKTPTIFTEQTETMQYKDVRPLNNVTAERSIGFTGDLNFKTKIINDLYFSINQMFFHTVINKPLVLKATQSQGYFFYNETKPIRSNGFETNIKLIFKDDLKLFAGYTYTNAKAFYLVGNNFLSLLPKSKLNLALVYEKENNFKIGIEGYFTGNQYLLNGNQVPSFWEFGFMAEKTFNKFTFFINFENFTDERQSNYKRVVNPPHDQPTFDDIWNHTEGFIVNGGIRARF